MNNDNTTAPPRDRGDPGDSSKDAAAFSAVSAAYRRAASEEPPPKLDTAVLEMAHREVNGIHVATPRPRWFVPVAVAATLVLAVSLGLQVSRTPSPTVGTAPSQDAFSKAPSADGATATQDNDAAADTMTSALAVSEQAAGDLASEPSAPPAEPAPSATAAPPAVITDQAKSAMQYARRVDAERMVVPMNQVAERRATEDAVREAVSRAREDARKPAEWLDIIASLVMAEEHEAARIEWLAFRRVHPDEPLPPGFPEIE